MNKINLNVLNSTNFKVHVQNLLKQSQDSILSEINTRRIKTHREYLEGLSLKTILSAGFKLKKQPKIKKSARCK